MAISHTTDTYLISSLPHTLAILKNILINSLEQLSKKSLNIFPVFILLHPKTQIEEEEEEDEEQED